MEHFLAKHEPTPNCIENQPQRAFASVIFALVLIGLFGNSLIMFIILALKEYKKSVANWYILQLALADTLFLITLPFTAASELVGKWNFGVEFCKIKEAIMSFDRYLAVTKAFASNKLISALRTPVASFVLSSIGWAFSILACTPLFMYSNLTECHECTHNFPKRVDEKNFWEAFYNTDDETLDKHVFDYLNINVTYAPNTLQCKYEDTYLTEWFYTNFIVAFCLPLVLICSFYGMILCAIINTRSVGNADSQQSYRRRVTLIVLGLIILFVASWLPWYTINLAKVHGLHVSPNHCQNLSIAARLMAYLNSALNPYFYSFMGTRFRERISRASSRLRTNRTTSRTKLGSREHGLRKSSNHTAQRSQRVHAVPMAEQGKKDDNVKTTNELEEGKCSTVQRTERTVL